MAKTYVIYLLRIKGTARVVEYEIRGVKTIAAFYSEEEAKAALGTMRYSVRRNAEILQVAFTPNKELE